MSTHPTEPPASGGSGSTSVDPALGEAVRALLGPIARLALAQGLTCAAVEEILKEAFVEEAIKARPEQGSTRMVSRISVATGLNRREVTRLTQNRRAVRTLRPTAASEVFTRWMTDTRWCDGPGNPLSLPRHAQDDDSPSFESLAHSVTRDVHPRSILDELCRLGIAEFDDATDQVHLVRNAFVPSAGKAPMLGFLADNVGDHLNAAVSNVLSVQAPHFEQAVFADELSVESLTQVRAFILGQWKSLMHGAVPLLEKLIEEDHAQGRAQDQRIRIGLYSYAETQPSTRSASAPEAPQ